MVLSELGSLSLIICEPNTNVFCLFTVKYEILVLLGLICKTAPSSMQPHSESLADKIIGMLNHQVCTVKFYNASWKIGGIWLVMHTIVINHLPVLFKSLDDGFFDNKWKIEILSAFNRVADGFILTYWWFIIVEIVMICLSLWTWRIEHTPFFMMHQQNKEYYPWEHWNSTQ